MQTKANEIIIRKYGGASLSSPEKICNIAKDISQIYKDNKKIILVVSAMGDTTNSLHQLAKSVSPTPSGRELDMLLSTGERVSGALICMALESLNIPAISFTGSQAGILTDSTHNNANIQKITAGRITNAIAESKVVVIAGYQGVDPISKDITTLGRGGTDTSAIALANTLGAKHVSMMKEVDGVCCSDPNLVSNANVIRNLNHDQLIAMTFWGANIIHHRASSLAKDLNISIHILPSHTKGEGTVVNSKADTFTDKTILCITSHKNVLLIKNSTKEKLEKDLNSYQSFLPQILSESDNEILFTAPIESLKTIQTILSKKSYPMTTDLSTVSQIFTSKESITSKINSECAMKKLNINFIKKWNDGLATNYLIESKDREKAITGLHNLI